MNLEHRLRQIERILKPKHMSPLAEKRSLFDTMPRETWVQAFGVLKDVGGYQYMIRPEDLKDMPQVEIDSLNQLTPEELYDLLADQRKGNPQAGAVS